MIRPEADNVTKDPHTPTGAPDVITVGRTPAENCARIKGLGYVASKQIKMYGQRFELVSDPFEEGNCIVVQVRWKRSNKTYASASGINSLRFVGST